MYRFAASLDDDLHIGDLRVALFNFLSAQKDEKGFIIRLEDTKKDLESKDKETLEILNLCGVSYDNVYYQSNNLKFHRQFAMSLMGTKKAFSCFCTEERLSKKSGHYDGTCEKLDDFDVLNNENPFVIRIKSTSKNMDSFIIMDHKKYPTTNFACATDDMLQGITHIILEENQKQNTQNEDFIRESLGYMEKIKYSFIRPIDEKQSVKELLDQGFLPNAIVNYLIAPNEIMTLQKAIEKFDIKSISKENASFDLEKLRQINREYIKQMDDLQLSSLVGFADEGIGKLVKEYAKELSTISEIKTKIDAIFATKELPEELSKTIQVIKEVAKQAPFFNNFNEYENYLIKTTKLKKDDISKPLRLLLTGDEKGLEINKLYPHLKNYIKEILR